MGSLSDGYKKRNLKHLENILFGNDTQRAIKIYFFYLGRDGALCRQNMLFVTLCDKIMDEIDKVMLHEAFGVCEDFAIIVGFCSCKLLQRRT